MPSTDPIQRPIWLYTAACALLLVLAAELVLSVRQFSHTVDEPIHLFAGYQYWTHADFGINPDHPPLVKLAAALPLLALGLKEQGIVAGGDRDVLEFMYDNARDVTAIFFWARMGASIFTYLLAVLAFLWAREMFGPRAALIALGLLVLEPNLLAHGAMVTTDMGATFGVFALVYAFYRYTQRPGWKRLAVCGGTAGVALAAKHSGILIGPILIALAAAQGIVESRAAKARPPAPPPKQKNKVRPKVAVPPAHYFTRRAVRLAAVVALILVAGAALLWVVYGFRWSARPEGTPYWAHIEDYARWLENPDTAAVLAALGRWHVLPESYLMGLANVLISTQGRPTYLLGHVYASGQWFYFPLVFLMKATLPVLGLLAASPWILRGTAAKLRFLLIPPAVYLGFSMASELNIGLRHILPIFPFLILIAAATLDALLKGPLAGRYAAGLALLWQAATSLHVFPNYLTYSNEAVGGPSRTWRLMSDSNGDWGQGVRQAAAYVAKHNIKDCWIAIRMSWLDPKAYGLPCKVWPVLPEDPATPGPITIDGTIIVSSHQATGQESGPGELNTYRVFLERKPDDMIGNSLLVFHGPIDVTHSAARELAHRAYRSTMQSRSDKEKAVADAQWAARLYPGSAEIQGALCLALRAAGREQEAGPACQLALSIAGRVQPEFQFRHFSIVRTVEQMARGAQPVPGRKFPPIPKLR
jgi:hypothetical protein